MIVKVGHLKIGDLIIGDVGTRLDYRIPRMVTWIRESKSPIDRLSLFRVRTLDADGQKRTVTIMPEETFDIIRR